MSRLLIPVMIAAIAALVYLAKRQVYRFWRRQEQLWHDEHKAEVGYLNFYRRWRRDGESH